METFIKLQSYMTGRKALLPTALVFSALSSVVGMLPLGFIWLIMRDLFLHNPQTLMHTYAWWAAGSAIVSVLLYFVALSLSHLAAFRVETVMRGKSMQQIIHMPLGFFDRHTSGEIRKMIDDNASITHSFLAHQLPDLAGTILMPLVSFILIFVFDWRLGLACLVPIVSSMGLMGYMMGARGQTFMHTYMNSLETMNSEAVEYVRGIPVVKVFQQTVFSFKSFYHSILTYKKLVSEYTRMWEKPMSLYTVLINGFAYFLVPPAILMINAGNIGEVILNLLLYILVTPVFSQCIMRSMYLNQALGQAQEAVRRIENLTATSPLPEAEQPQNSTGFDISFDQVSFSYPGINKEVLNQLSFTIPEGKTYAMVGPSGSGKTTIARLLPRFWDVEKGSVCIGGGNVKDFRHQELMDKVSFVFQNTRLFKTSLEENILYGNPHASQAEIEAALEAAQCQEIIQRLPHGLQTKIGTEGTYLSGGEQQRIALARAILKNAPIVVLDEATAFTDPENEHLIQSALQKLRKGKTVLMIAHRLTSVQDVDQILVIQHGMIAERGTHDELVIKKGIYSEMWNEYQKSIHWTIKNGGNHA